MYRPGKIISGGQTGADRGALLGAADVGIKTGGWAPKGWQTERGSDPTLRSFGLVQHSSPNYPPRTRMNCQDSDLTAIFGDTNSTGAKLAISICREDDIPYILNPIPAELRRVCEMLKVQTLNIAGNRASRDTDIEERVRAIVRDAFA